MEPDLRRPDDASGVFDDHLRLQTLMSEVMAGVARADASALDVAIDGAMGRVGEWLHVDRVYVFEIDGDVCHNTHEWCAPGVTAQIDELQDLPLETIRWWPPRLSQGEQVHVPDVALLPDERSEERELLASQDIRSLLVVPLLSLGELFGFVGFDVCGQTREFTISETSLLRALSDIIGASSVRRRADEALVASEERANEALHLQATTDALTGLPNRFLLLDRIEQACARARRTGGTNAVVMLDLDGFGLVNDSRGHHAGDDLLCRVADRIRTTIRANDTCARFGGDEFMLLLDDVGDLDAAMAMLNRVREQLAAPMVVSDGEHRLTASFGIRLCDGDTDPDSLVREAEIAMQEAKREGRNRVVVFDDGMRESAVRRMVLASRLRLAVERDEIEVAYQPLVDTATGAIVGAEALARWTDDQLGVVSPGEFIPLAEETGLVTALGERVLHHACTEAAGWPPHLTLSVNLARQQLVDPTLPFLVLQTCEDVGLDTERLEVEVTESTVMTDLHGTVFNLTQLRSAGVTVAIDDFGTGHSSLALLRDLPADRLKIDRSFVDRLVDDDLDRRLVRAVCGVADDFDLAVLAEGVETEQQRDVLVEIGVPAAQGWLFGRPMPGEAFRCLVAERGSSARLRAA